jgi:hypothetical protein
MSYDLTGQKVSLTYKSLLQYVDGSFYDGAGNPVLIDASSSVDLTNYISDASLGCDFYWSGGLLYVDVSVVAGGVTRIYVDGSLAARDASIAYLYDTKLDPSIDYLTYAPRVSDVSFFYDYDGNVQNIRSHSDTGQKNVDFVYNLAGDVSMITIDNYGLNQKVVTFDSDPYGNIIAVHIS